jgi:hypothetical protein
LKKEKTDFRKVGVMCERIAKLEDQLCEGGMYLSELGDGTLTIDGSFEPDKIPVLIEWLQLKIAR